MSDNSISIEALLGKTLVSIEKRGEDELIFTTETGEVYRMYHDSDCCETVYIEDICGDLGDLIGSMICIAREDTNEDFDERAGKGEETLWTFYNIASAKGSVNIRWFGVSHWSYSLSVSFEKLETEND